MANDKTTPKGSKKDAKPKTDAELRTAWGTRANKTITTLERAAKNTERLMKRSKPASEAQIKAFRENVSALVERVTRASKGEAAVGAVPLE